VTSRAKIGDIFQVRIDPSAIRYFQYVADDMTQLGSNVVRIFRGSYAPDEPIDVARLTEGDIDFHAHVFLGIGLKKKLWHKVGHAPPPSDLDILFRDTNDFGNPQITVSRNWHVWTINGRFQKVGELLPEHQQAEVGVIVPPDSLLYRMRNGRYDFFYPDFQR
jgi:hypothetical protein